MLDSNQPALTWRVCPATLHPKKALFAWMLIIVVGGLMASSSLLLGFFGVLILIATQATFFFSTRFSIDANGIRAKFPIQRKQYSWSRVRRVMFGREGCCFFTRKKASTFDGFSGLPVFYGSQRDEIEAVIKTYLPEGVAEVWASPKGAT